MNLDRILRIVGGVWLLAAMSLSAQTNAPGVRFQFREPHRAAYRVELPRGTRLAGLRTNDWLKARIDDGSTNAIQVGSRIVLQLKPGAVLNSVLAGRPLQLSRTVAGQMFILQAPDPWTGAVQAEQLAALPEVVASHPVTRRPKQLHSAYAPKPNDPYFQFQWYLENRAADGTPLGPDLNIRSAWPITRGEGVTIAICDDGFEQNHPDLASRAANTNHFNFTTGTTNGNPVSVFQAHATAVAGLAAADGGNGRGIAGTAPGAQLASWVIFGPNDFLASDEQLMDMYQYRSNVVSVQNHSWGSGVTSLADPTLIELVGLTNAIVNGRNGLGIVMVRAGGNNRAPGGNVNDDHYPADPRVIAVAAIRSDGRATRYSSPGAPLLVAAPSAEVNSSGFGIDGNFPSLFTTDRQGGRGYNQISFTNDFADYAFDALGFSGTSGSAPQISGLAALILSVNPALSYRDVQQILLFSARQTDLADPDLSTNGAGFVVSHNTGFGVPDAGVAVRLATAWPKRPALTNATVSFNGPLAIPDGGLQVKISGPGIDSSMYCFPSLGLHVDTATAPLPLVDVGQALGPINLDLTGKVALIQRGINNFSEKIGFAAQAGAAAAVIYNNAGDGLIVMGDTDYVTIPAVFIPQSSGEVLKTLLNAGAQPAAQIALTKATIDFAVTNTLLCEHVAVHIKTDHPRRADLRITLVSPQGTRSVLQRLNNDDVAGPEDWIYYTTHHFYEASAGHWHLEVSDETTPLSGSVLSADLTVYGVAIKDTDHNGLDDDWELAQFSSLGNDPKADPDADGYSNMREQIMGTNPLAAEIPFTLDLSTFNEGFTRLSWPSSTNYTYQVFGLQEVAGTTTLLTNVVGKFPETEVFFPYTNSVQGYFRIQRSGRVR